MGRVSGIRDATAVDAAAICRIYNRAIEDRIATLETEERTPEERRAWLAARGLRHPVLVAEADGVVVGWASLNVVARARELGYHKLVLSAFPGNEAGMRAYRRAGFRDVGVYREQGRLDGRWVDTIVMERRLEGPHAH